MTNPGEIDKNLVTCMIIVRGLASVIRETTDLGAS
jgi:hypothetical protein